ncbi:MAG: phosphotriesterase-related protein [Chloroflexota bacterium]|nr:phosphotriesterase-related protein [Chloroflexota bacterium]
MSQIDQKGKIQTVLGLIDPKDLGLTMTHEHLLIDFSVMFNPTPDVTTQRMAHTPVSMENLGWIRQYCYSNLDNLLVLDEETAIEEAMLYQRHGGGAIVDATTIGIGRDPLALARISRGAGVHVVMGAGYYVDAAQPNEINNKNEDDIYQEIIKDVQLGVGNTGIKAGIIGEIGCTWPLMPNEIKVLKASARAQLETGLSILIHPGRDEKAPIEILRILADSGADLSRVIMGHLDRTVSSLNVLEELADTGCVLEWDLFGNEISFYQPSDFDMPSDAERLNFIRHMTDIGLGDRIVISHDICTKHRLVKYGGHGYGYIPEHIIPRMRNKNFEESEIEAITRDTPARLLTMS